MSEALKSQDDGVSHSGASDRIFVANFYCPSYLAEFFGQGLLRKELVIDRKR